MLLLDHQVNLQKKCFQSRRQKKTGFSTYTFGCPVFVLEPLSQQGHKISKWQPRARQAICLGHSPQHAQTVPIVLNINTGFCSPQYHVIFDDTFSIVKSRVTNIIPQTWDHLFTHNRINVLEGEPEIQDSIHLIEESARRRPRRDPSKEPEQNPAGRQARICREKEKREEK
jgi:hypothetical protein